MKTKPTVEQLEDRRLLCAACPGFRSFLSNTPTLPQLGYVRAAAVSSDAEYDLGVIAEGTNAIQGVIGGRDRADLFGFELDQQAEINLQLSARFGQRLTLLDSQLRVIETDSVFLGNGASVGKELAAGTYFVSVSNNSLLSDRYRLQFDVERIVPDGAGNTLSTAYDLGTLAGQTLNGHVGGRDSADVFSFNIDDPSTIAFRLNGLSEDVDLYLRNDSGRVLGSSRNADALSESLTTTLSRGSYYAVVRPYGNAVSDYHFQINSTAVQPPPTQPPPTQMPPAQPSQPTRPLPAQPEPTPVAPSPNTPVLSDLPPVDYFGGNTEWNLNSVDAPESWAAGFTGNDVIVAVIDTGVDLQHVDLNQNLWTSRGEIAGDGIDNDHNGYVDDVYGWNFVGNNNNPDDFNGHGTHVAGTIAAESNSTGSTGVAFNATVMPVKVLADDGQGSDYSVARGIQYAVDNGADIINLSLGSSSNSRYIRNALEYAATNDVLVVAASGNESSSIPSYPAIHSRDLANVISVGALDRVGEIASFSNRVGASRAVQVDAPGVQIYSTLPGNRYGTLSGTSMATPHVAGVAALTLSANPDLTAAQLKTLLTQQVGGAAHGSDSTGAVDASLVVARAQSRRNETSTASAVAANRVASIDAFFANA
ncbi:MAG: S8 family serine peptidase [Planctomycetales bacterium]|nr:S8 family serine peptidase [Planctomycetales bacterium]